jgi:hypothetical protein
MEARNSSGHSEYFVGDRKRLATCTGVRIVDANHIVCSSLAGQQIYLWRRTAGGDNWVVIDSVNTTYYGERVCTDLIDHDDGFFITSNCAENSVSLYRLVGHRLLHAQDYPINDPDTGFCHGAAFVPGGRLLCATTQTKGRNIYLLCRQSGAVVYRFSDEDWLPKDVAFLDSSKLLIGYTRAHAGKEPTTATGSKFALVSLAEDYRSHRVEWESPVALAQIDSISHSFGELMVTAQNNDAVHRFILRPDGLDHAEKLTGFNFPHGVDLDRAAGILAVTNYGDNTLELRSL